MQKVPGEDPMPIGDGGDPVPVATVVVLGYNGRGYADGCLAALADQSPDTPPFEVLFFDNASTDGTPELVESRFPSVRVIRSATNLGYAAGNVAALAHVTTRWVAFLNQDTIVSRGWLHALLEAARETGAAAVHGSMIVPWQACFAAFDRTTSHGHLHIAELTRAAYVGYAVTAGPSVVPTLFLSGAGFLIDREILSRVGGLFEADFWAYCEDTDLALRLRAAGEKVVVAREASFLHDLTPTTTISVGGIAKALRILRNRHLACMRSMSVGEYIRSLPVIVLGAGGKAEHIPTRGIVSVLVRPGMIMLSVVALGWAVGSLPRHVVARRRTLATRVGGPTAIVDALERADDDLGRWRQDPPA